MTTLGDAMPPIMAVKVLYRMPGKSAVRGDYIVSNIKELLGCLRAEGVTITNCDYMYVHHQPDRASGQVMELLAIDNQGEKRRNNVVPFEKSKPAVSKPHVRLKADDSPPIVTERSFLYTSRQV